MKRNTGLFAFSAILGVIFGYRFVALRNAIPEAVRGGKTTGEAIKEEEVGHRRTMGVADGIPDKPRGENDIHIVFSTDCSPYQDWQSFLVFHSARASGNLGRITRIASGCSDEAILRLREIHRKLPPQNDLHFTPDYTIYAADGEVYPFNNKPHGFVHFLANVEPPITSSVIAVLDPDMIVLRKLTPFLADEEIYRPGHPDEQVRGKEKQWVTKGHPVAQSYGYGGDWARWPEMKPVMPADSPIFNMTDEHANKFYTAGPPYLLHVADWQAMSKGWAHYTPVVLKHHPGLLAEMQAWSLGAVEAKLPHTVVYSWMASDLEGGWDEEWQIIDELPPEHACIGPDDFRALHASRGLSGKPRPIPSVLHYCQLYREGLYMFAKRHPDLYDIFRCGGPLMREPPPHVTTMHTKVHPHGSGTRIEELNDKNAKRQTAALCLSIKSMNDALRDFRKRSCPPDPNPPELYLTDLRAEDLADVERWKQLNVIRR